MLQYVKSTIKQLRKH